MFLTKKAYRKILVLGIVYFALGSFSVAFSLAFRYIIGDLCDLFMDFCLDFLLVVGIISYLLCVIVPVSGRYTEGKGNLMILGNKLVRKELKPAEFILHYQLARNASDLVIVKPSIEVLQLVATAYDLLGDKEKMLEALEEMVAVASAKKKNFAKLLKCSFLFSCNRTEEAEAIFNEVQKQKLNMMCNGLVDMILKSDRAMAMGDYKTVELFILKTLKQSFPKPDNLVKLVGHYTLGEVYENLQDNNKAIIHYQYCVNFGGETVLQKSAVEKLQCLESVN